MSSVHKQFDDESGLSDAAGTVVEDMRARIFVRNRESEDIDDGLSAILVPRFDGWFLRRFLMPHLKKPLFQIRLDAAGTYVWKALDGRLTVGQTADSWQQENPDEPLAHARVAIFVRALALQGHVLEKDPTAAC